MASEAKKGGPGDAADRQERLAAALRANLKRRKEQARARDAAGDGPSPEAPAKTETSRS